MNMSNHQLSSDNKPGVNSRIPGWLPGALIIPLAGFFMVYWCWGTWPDVLIDFGRELYVPWRLTEGQVLFRDIAYFNGPLSPYINALWFSLFGTSLLTLVVCNVVLLGCFTALLYRMTADVGDWLAATGACLAFLTIFAFGLFMGFGIFNFVTPYSHEATHGIMLAFASLYCLWRFEPGRKNGYLVAAGLTLGLVFLTKVELFIAAAAADFIFLFMMNYGGQKLGRRIARDITLFLGCVMLPPLVAVGLLSLSLPVSEAVRGTLGGWPHLSNDEITSLLFYKKSMGLDQPWENTVLMLKVAIWYVLIVTPAIVIALLPANIPNQRRFLAAAWAILISGYIAFAWSNATWLLMPRPLPLALAPVLVGLLTLWWTRPVSADVPRRLIRSISLVVFAVMLLPKIILNLRVAHYGFFLAMPAAIVLVLAMIAWLPAYIDKRGGYGAAVRMLGIAVLVVTIGAHFRMNNFVVDSKIVPVGKGSDAFRTWNTDRGRSVAQALPKIETLIGPEQTLVVLPEGVMLNYLTRRITPIPHINFMPLELIMFGEDRILDDLRDTPPHFIVLAHKATSDYGYRFFGRDYGQRIMHWVNENYEVIEQIGAPPLRSNDFGIQILRQNRRGRLMRDTEDRMPAEDRR